MQSVDTKRVVDVVVSALLLVVTVPVVLVLAALSAVALRAWPFFVQERVGRHGRIFRFIKIRTLPPTCSSYAPKTELDTVGIPRSMRLLRATHLDELPQFWLVLTGKMSLVGPRPEMAVLHDLLASDAAAERLSVRPGITGLWQISAHCDGLICDRLEYDRLYVRFGNVRFDAWIMLKTAEKMLLGRRIHLFHVPHRVIGIENVAPAGRLAADTPSVVVDLTERPTITLPLERFPLAVGAD